MSLRSFILSFLIFLAPLPALAADPYGAPRLEIVAQMKQRPGNIAVAHDGRMFVSLTPFDNPIYKVMEVAPDGTAKPYPTERWSREPNMDGVGLASVIHLKAMGDTLYILDMGSAQFQPKLVAWDMKAEALKRVWYLPNAVSTPQSFHQDFVMTPDEKNVFIADMGQADLAGKAEPALVHLSLETGMARRVLAGAAALRPSAKQMMAGGAPMFLTKNGKQVPLYLGLNPITIDPKGVWVYMAPMAEGTLVRVRVADLLNTALTADDLSKKIEDVGKKPPSDGMIADGLENIFITSVNDGSIGVINNKGKYSTWIRDPLISWPDGLAFGPDGGIYVTAAQLHLAAPFQGGTDKSTPPYMILRVMGGRPMEEKE